MDSITTLSATDLAQNIRARNCSPVEVVAAHLQRIEELNSSLNAIVTLATDVQVQALAAERAVLDNSILGPLHGVPLTIKDTIETRGLLSTSGCALRKDFVPAEDAPAVARLRAAGAIILGKTNAAEMAMEYTADNPVFGRTNNPYNSLHTPGGSSGGEAVAIASGMSAGGLGSDLAGSVRVPAHFCGIAGLKPTVGRVPGEGQFPASVGPYSLGSVIGPMARCVKDLKLIFSVLAGEGYSAGRVDSDHGLKGTRVAWYTDDGVAKVTAETRLAVQAAATALARAGLIVEESRPPGVESGHELWLKLFSRASVVQLRKVYEGHENVAGGFVQWRLRTADDTPPPSLDDYIASWMLRDVLRERLLKWMETTPLLLAPVGAVNAPLHDTLKVRVEGVALSIFRAFSYAQTFNVFDLPSVCIPAGRAPNGLPIGVQIVGRPFAESEVLRAAAVVEAALGDWRKLAIH